MGERLVAEDRDKMATYLALGADIDREDSEILIDYLIRHKALRVVDRIGDDDG